MDVAIIGAGIGGLSCASILSSVYGIHTEVFEAHNHIGGCAHSFPIKSAKSNAVYNFDSGPTIILGCSKEPLNPLQQVLNACKVGDRIEWITYDRWGMRDESNKEWIFQLGPDKFEEGPLSTFDTRGTVAIEEFRKLRELCLPLCSGASQIPTMALRDGRFKLLPLFNHWDALQKVIPYADELESNFESFMEKYVTKDSWLESWLDALAFSLSALPAAKTGAATMAYTLFDLHRHGAVLDYPRGGVGRIAEVFEECIKENGGDIFTNSGVKDIVVQDGKAVGIILCNGDFVRANRGVVCNAPIWSLPSLLKNQKGQMSQEQKEFFFKEAPNKEATKSFLHLHIGLDATGLDTSKMEAHYTVMHKGLHGKRGEIDPCGDRNMVAVSNPSILDDTLVKGEKNRMVVHAYGAGNENYNDWEHLSSVATESIVTSLDGCTSTYENKYKEDEAYNIKKENDAEYLYEAISKALKISVAEIKEREEVSMIGTPLTHERFLKRFKGTYGSAWGNMLKETTTPISGLYLCGDSIFPGIGLPAVAVSGAQCANSLVSVGRHMLVTAFGKRK